MTRRSLFVAALVLAAGCASSAPAPGAEPGPRSATARRNPERITREEIVATGLSDALAVVQRLRPEWLRVRLDYMGPVWVYRDGVRMGGVDTLRGIDVSQIQELRHVPSSQSGAQFGTDVSNGVILVVTRR